MRTKFKSEEEKYAYAIAISCNAWDEEFEMPSGRKYIFPKPRYGKMNQSQLEAIVEGYNIPTALEHKTSLS